MSKKSWSFLVLFCLPLIAGPALSSKDGLNKRATKTVRMEEGDRIADTERQPNVEDLCQRPPKFVKGEEGGRIVNAETQSCVEGTVITYLPSDIIRKIGCFLTLGETTEQGHKNLHNYMLTCKKFNANCQGDTLKKNLMYLFMSGFYYRILDRFNSFPNLIAPDEADVGGWLKTEDDQYRQSRIVFERFLGDEEGQLRAVSYCKNDWRKLEQLLNTQRFVGYFFWFDACCKRADISNYEYSILDAIMGYVAMTDDRWNAICDESKVLWQVRRVLRQEMLPGDKLQFITPAVIQLRNCITGVIFSQDTVHIGSFRFVAPILSLMTQLQKFATDEVWPLHIHLPNSTKYCRRLTEVYLQSHLYDMQMRGKIPLPQWVCGIKGLRGLYLNDSDYIVPNLAHIYPDIEVLEIGGCFFEKTPYWIAKLTKLKKLVINMKHIFPHVITKSGDHEVVANGSLYQQAADHVWLTIDNENHEELKACQQLLSEIKAHNKKLKAEQP